MFATAILASTLVSCEFSEDNAIKPYQRETYKLRVLTFEDKDYKGDANMVGEKSWSSLIDSAQYGGELLYPADETLYRWNDKYNTYLAHDLTNSWFDYQYWGGGHAISNYQESDLTKGNFMTQLAIPLTGHNGSKNFCVHNGYATYPGAATPELYFSDNKTHIVDHMYVTNTTYVLNNMKNGDGFSEPLPADGWFKIIATGYDRNGEQTGVAEFYLAKDGKIVDKWEKFDLSVLGYVQKISFTVDGSDQGAWGLNTPAYFAYDDVAVRFDTF